MKTLRTHLASKLTVSTLVLATCLHSFALVAPTAAAQSSQSAQNSAAAETLFRDAKALMADGKYKQACPKLEASQRLDPATGTLLNLAICHEKTGKTASAWAEYLETAYRDRNRPGREARRKYAKEAAKRLEGNLSRLQLNVPAAVRVPGLAISRDGQKVDNGLWGTAIPVDPGPHKIRATAPEYKDWEGKVTIKADGTTQKFAVPKLVKAPKKKTPDKKKVVPPPPVVPEKEKEDPGAGQRTLGYVLGAAGIIGLGVGTGLGLKAQSDWDKAKAACPGNVCTTQADQDNASAVSGTATGSTVAFSLGGLALAGGLLLILTAPSAEEAAPGRAKLQIAPTVTPQGSGFIVGGSF